MTDKSAREILREWSFVERCGHYPHTEVEKPCPHCDGTAHTILAALEAGGFAVVPKVPTQDMRVAGVGALATSFKPEADRLRALPKQDMPPAWTVISVVSSQNTDPVWSAMLAASNPKEEGSDN